MIVAQRAGPLIGKWESVKSARKPDLRVAEVAVCRVIVEWTRRLASLSDGPAANGGSIEPTARSKWVVSDSDCYEAEIRNPCTLALYGRLEL